MSGCASALFAWGSHLRPVVTRSAGSPQSIKVLTRVDADNLPLIERGGAGVNLAVVTCVKNLSSMLQAHLVDVAKGFSVLQSSVARLEDQLGHTVGDVDKLKAVIPKVMLSSAGGSLTVRESSTGEGDGGDTADVESTRVSSTSGAVGRSGCLISGAGSVPVVGRPKQIMDSMLGDILTIDSGLPLDQVEILLLERKIKESSFTSLTPNLWSFHLKGEAFMKAVASENDKAVIGWACSPTSASSEGAWPASSLSSSS